jgi:hypothetical protein
MSPVQNKAKHGPAGGARNPMYGSRLRSRPLPSEGRRLCPPKPKSHGRKPRGVAHNRSGSARGAAGTMTLLACRRCGWGIAAVQRRIDSRAVSAPGLVRAQKKERIDVPLESPFLQ